MMWKDDVTEEIDALAILPHRDLAGMKLKAETIMEE